MEDEKKLKTIPEENSEEEIENKLIPLPFTNEEVTQIAAEQLWNEDLNELEEKQRRNFTRITTKEEQRSK